jgi:peptidoglycan glycosyltransferase
LKKSEEQQTKQKRKKQGKEKKNHELAVVTYLFAGLFALLIGYFVYFDAVLRPDVINNPYNSRQESFADRVIRGSILSSDGEVLAETKVASDGTETRNYPYANVFSHVVGYSTRGKTGIESLANFSLLTSNAFFGERIANEIREEKNVGDNVVTTLNATLQQTAYDALGSHRGAVVVLEVETGKVLAMVSKPDYDPNRINQNWESLTAEGESEGALYNRASQGLYAPGSTFKIITLLEYMRENAYYADFNFDCTGSYTEGNYTISCYGKTVHGAETLKEAFAKSCNGAFASIGLSLNTSSFTSTCRSLLFQSELPFDLPYSTSSFTLKEDATPAERMMTGIGQGETLVSPLHMAMLVSSIANGGLLMKPYLLDHIETYQGDLVKNYHSSAYGSLMTESEADVLTEYMEEVVATGTGKKLNDLGFSVAGKTGTAEYSSDKTKSHAWFAGFSETGEADIAVCVLVEEAGSGSEYAVPIARKIFAAWAAGR